MHALLIGILVFIMYLYNSWTERQIVLQPYSDFSNQEAIFIKTELEKYYPRVSINKPIPLPNEAYYPPRNRYRANVIIRLLKKTAPENSKIIGITNTDISISNGKHTDWGVMGLGYMPGKSCVVSTFRLNNQQKKEELFKIVLHELGHTEGLPHCINKTCLMRDAEGKNRLQEEKGFCKICRFYLSVKGWNL